MMKYPVAGGNDESRKKKGVPGVELVLNGGKKEMDAATIPIRWFFSDEVIAKNPKRLIFFEQNKREAKSYEAGNLGRRYVCDVSLGVMFIQLFSPGYHRIMVMLIDDERSPSAFLKTTGNDHYEISAPWASAEDNDWLENANILAAAVVEFVVPKELFAKEPETRFEKIVWKWVNLWYKKQKPRDECEYRGRKFLAFTLKPVLGLLWLLWFLIRKPFAAVFGSLYLIITSVAVFFIGFRPSTPWSGFWNYLRGREGFNMDVMIRKSRDGETYGYRIWYQEEEGGKLVQRKMIVAPWEVAVIPSMIIVILNTPQLTVFSGKLFVEIIGTLLMLLFSAVLIIWLSRLFLWLRGKLFSVSAEILAERKEQQIEAAIKKRSERAAKRKALAEKRERAYQDWLRANYSLGKNSGKVILSEVPPALRKDERIVQVFKTSFWALKAKICRPYSR